MQATTMPSKKPNIGNLLALLEVFLALQPDILPGGTATVAELDFAEKNSPIKGEDVKPGPWPGLTSSSSVEASPASVAGAPSFPPIHCRRLLGRLGHEYDFPWSPLWFLGFLS
ncbi:hypothetical protein FPSE5266_10988 [Fusarium pseudograminearum]|nr:hypothetical protein FPSE5266_10988 [Fusarium pseudograminearum]